MKKEDRVISIENKNFEYDAEIDNFYIYADDCSEEIIGSISLGNLVYDIGSSGRVVGLEIDNASQVLNVSPSLLENAEGASLSVNVQGNIMFLVFKVILTKKELVFQSVIPRNKINIAV